MPLKNKVEFQLPLNPRVFAIMLAFTQGSAHGYQIKKTVEKSSGGAIKIDAGSLYRSIAKLVDGGMLAESGERPDTEMDDTRRRYYELSERGRQLVAAEARRLAHQVDFARASVLIEESGR